MAEDPPLRGLKVAILGIGEAGSAIAADLVAAGATVSCFDPADVAGVAGTRRAAQPEDAVTGADLVMAVTAATDAPAALEQALAAIPAHAVYADLATASAQCKRDLAGRAGERALDFVDVALMATVPGKGLYTPALASGPGAERYAQLLHPAHVPVTPAGDEPGTAATRKLLRSVVTKGLAALIIEAMRAAEAAGLAAVTWENVCEQLVATDEAFVRRLVEGTSAHAVRRRHEMEAAAALLTNLGVEPIMTRATVENLRRVPTDGVPDSL